MADVYVNALTTISTEPGTTDSVVCVNRNTNEGQIIDYNLLADKILDKLTSKQYSALTTTSKLLTGAINELDSDVASLNSSVESKADYTVATTSSNWDTSDAPEAFLQAMPSRYKTYIGTVNASATCVAIGMKASDTTGVVMMFTYSSAVHFWVKWQGTWTKRTFTVS